MADGFPVSGAQPARLSDAQKRLHGPIHQERHVKIICVGAGASGLLLAYKLQKHFQNFTLTIYEKNPDISGTWYENKYPGYA
jgi:cation diffusion facilitator CzcD-associated flavoprotein CzcO